MALTATATDATLASVKSRLAMEDVVIIGLRPDRSNIKLIVEPCPDIIVLCESLAKDLLDNCTKATKTVIFCRSLKDCGKMCITFKKLLGKSIVRDTINFHIYSFFKATLLIYNMLHPLDIIGQQYLACGYHNQLALKPRKCLQLNVYGFK